MSNGSTFRTASAESSSPSDSVSFKPTPAPILSEKAEGQGLFVYETLNGHPMTAKHFGMMPHWESPTSEMQDRITQVDQWVQTKARERNLTDSKASYNEVIDSVLKQIGKSPNETKQATFERVSSAIEAYKRLESAKLPQILDVKSMTTKEYRKTRA